MSKHRVMTHMVAFYPDRQRSFQVARALIDAGASYIELQFPFSDPSADGPVIQEACSRALEAGFSLEEGFALAKEIREYADVPLFIMTYANPVVVMGVETFVRRAREVGAEGLIVPDLVPGDDEGLYAAGRKAGLPIVPVVVPTVTAERLAEISALGERYIYTALRQGITGRETAVGEETLRFLESCSATGMLTLAGFGIRSVEQIELLEPHVHAPVVGSALVNVITQSVGGDADDMYRNICEFAGRLCGV